MNMMLAIGSMLSATPRAWSMPTITPPAPQPLPPSSRRGSVKRHQRDAAKARARRRAKRLGQV
jgi:hypothetical protein